MSDLQPNVTHVEQGLERRLERFRGKPRFEALLRVLLARAQRFDDVLAQVYNGVWLDNAAGAQLDALGWIVGEPRLARGDTSYRVRIRARIAINRSNGKAPELLAVARLVLEPTASVSYTPTPPASFVVEVRDTALDIDDIFNVIGQVRAAGVGAYLISAADADTALIWDDTGSAHAWDAGVWADDRSI